MKTITDNLNNILFAICAVSVLGMVMCTIYKIDQANKLHEENMAKLGYEQKKSSLRGDYLWEKK